MSVNAKSLLAKALKAAKADASIGFCIACGKKASGVEPDARKYPCAGCGKNAVYGAEEIVMILA